MKIALTTLAFAGAFLSSVMAGSHNKDPKAFVAAKWANTKKSAAGIDVAEKLTIDNDEDVKEMLIYSKKGVAVWARCMGKDAPTVDAPDMGCDRTPCGQIYVELDEPADWFGGCENGDTKILPDLKDFNGICALINGNGDTFAEWYYGASMQHKSGRYVYSDALSLMVGQAPFGEARTCYFGGTFYDQFPKIALDSSRYKNLKMKRGD